MKVLSHTNWGADRTVLLQLYRSLIRTKLDYGYIVYGSARKSYLMMLDTVHHHGLRLALGAFRTSPVESLFVEAEEPSLYLRREKLALQYAIRLAAYPSNPTFKVTFAPHISQDLIDLYDNKPNAIRSFGLRIAPLLTSANINKEQIETHSVSEIPSWCIRKPIIDLSLHSEKKSESNPHLLKQNFHELQSYYSDHEHIYTDFTAEAKAIDLALDFVNTCTYTDKFFIFSDSLSVLQALNHTSSKNSQIQHLLLKHHEISSSKTVIYCWIPSNIGIYGNEKVDKNAKESLNLDQTDFKIPFNNFKPFINKYIFNKWQSSWNETCFNKLKEIEPVVNHHRTVPKLSRREEIILARLRIGHTRLTHSYLLKREEQPYCIGCVTPFTVRHFLLDCADFDRERRSLFQVNNLKDLFKDVSVENILSFLKNVNLFNKI